MSRNDIMLILPEMHRIQEIVELGEAVKACRDVSGVPAVLVDVRPTMTIAVKAEEIIAREAYQPAVGTRRERDWLKRERPKHRRKRR